MLVNMHSRLQRDHKVQILCRPSTATQKRDRIRTILSGVIPGNGTVCQNGDARQAALAGCDDVVDSQSFLAKLILHGLEGDLPSGHLAFDHATNDEAVRHLEEEET